MKHRNRPSDYASILKEARTPAVPNVAPGPEYSGQRRLFQGIPSIERSLGGRLWATWYAGGQGEGPQNYVLLATSADDGEHWTEPILVIDPPGHVRAADPNVWLDPEGKLWLFWMQAHTLHDGRWGVWAITTESPDLERPTWSAPRRLADGVMLNKPTVCRNGEWLFPISLPAAAMLDNEQRMLPRFLRSNVLSLMTPEEVRAVDEREGAHVYVSNDRGQTFARRGCAKVPASHPTHNEHMIVERTDRSLWMLLRTSYGIGESVSTDGGATWGPVTESVIPHPATRFFLRRLRSGNLLLVKHGPIELAEESGKPNAFGRSHLFAYLSEDDGRSWTGGLLLEERACSYPDGTQSPDGTIYIIYDHGRREERMILMACLTEEDIFAGKFASTYARPRALINQATGVIPEERNWKRLNEGDVSGDSLIFTGI